MTYTFGPILHGEDPGAVVVGVYECQKTEGHPGFAFTLVGYAVIVLPDGNVQSFGLDEFNDACAHADALNGNVPPPPVII